MLLFCPSKIPSEMEVALLHKEHLGTSGNIQEHLGTYINIQDHLGTSRNIWEHLGTPENIQEHLGTSRNTQTNLWDTSYSIHLRTLGHLDHCSQSSANNLRVMLGPITLYIDGTGKKSVANAHHMLYLCFTYAIFKKSRGFKDIKYESCVQFPCHPSCQADMCGMSPISHPQLPYPALGPVQPNLVLLLCAMMSHFNGFLLFILRKCIAIQKHQLLQRLITMMLTKVSFDPDDAWFRFFGPQISAPLFTVNLASGSTSQRGRS